MSWALTLRNQFANCYLAPKNLLFNSHYKTKCDEYEKDSTSKVNSCTENKGTDGITCDVAFLGTLEYMISLATKFVFFAVE